MVIRVDPTRVAHIVQVVGVTVLKVIQRLMGRMLHHRMPLIQISPKKITGQPRGMLILTLAKKAQKTPLLESKYYLLRIVALAH